MKNRFESSQWATHKLALPIAMPENCLDPVYVDGIVFKVRETKRVKTVYIAIGLNIDGKKKCWNGLEK
ncbi:MAG: transposase [Crocinitomicaceae bacterium]|nr:transposase [Crocinitomicaceae bacterium]